METIIGKISLREYFACDLHHGRRKIQCHLPYGIAFTEANLFKYGYDSVGVGSFYHRYQRAGSTMTGGIGDHRIQLAAAESRLINGYDGADVMFVQDPVLRMVKLAPLPETAENLLVLTRKVGAADTVMRPDGIYAFCRAINPLLLKKPRTPG